MSAAAFPPVTGTKYRVTIATTDGEVIESYTTAPIQPGRPMAVAREALKDAMTLNSLGDTEWDATEWADDDDSPYVPGLEG